MQLCAEAEGCRISHRCRRGLAKTYDGWGKYKLTVMGDGKEEWWNWLREELIKAGVATPEDLGAPVPGIKHNTEPMDAGMARPAPKTDLHQKPGIMHNTEPMDA